MKSLAITCLFGVALMGGVLAVHANRPAGQRGASAANPGKEHQPLSATPAPQEGLSGCEATLKVNVEKLASDPAVRMHLDWIWSRGVTKFRAKRHGENFLEDISNAGLTSWKQVRAVTVCIPAAAQLGREADAFDRAGFLLSGDVPRGVLVPFLTKWAPPRDLQLRELHGIEVVNLDDVRFAQRPDGGIVVARHDSSLLALLEAPRATARPTSGFYLDVRSIAAMFPEDAIHNELPTNSLQRLKVRVSPGFDFIDASLTADNSMTATLAAALFNRMMYEINRTQDRGYRSYDRLAAAKMLASALGDAKAVHRGTEVHLTHSLRRNWIGDAVGQIVEGL